MAKAKTSIKTSRKAAPPVYIRISLTKKNYLIIALGIALIVIGYILMAANSVDGFLPTVVAPVLLVAGYCVVIPVGILIKDKNLLTDESAVQTAQSGNATASNIKTN